jgi:Gas vesicle synthesis protein GvpL/GvpF
MIWLYAVCEQPERPLARVRGLEDRPVEGIESAELLAVATRHVAVPEVAVVDALWTHERVIEAVQAERAVVPVRFGTREPGAGSVRAALAASREALLAALERVRGRVELAVRALEPERVSGGRAYLARRRRAAQLHEALAAYAVDARRRPEHGGELLRASYLVEPASLGAFREAVMQLQASDPRLKLVCTGPWPAYSFAEPEWAKAS